MVKARDVVVRSNGKTSAPKELRGLLSSKLEDSLILAYVDAVHYLLVQNGLSDAAADFADQINEAFHFHRVKYRFIASESEIINLESEVLHVHVVEPTLKLLHGRPEFKDAHDAYMEALKEIPITRPMQSPMPGQRSNRPCSLSDVKVIHSGR